MKLPKLTKDTKVALVVAAALGAILAWPQLQAWARRRGEAPAASDDDDVGGSIGVFVESTDTGATAHDQAWTDITGGGAP